MSCGGWRTAKRCAHASNVNGSVAEIDPQQSVRETGPKVTGFSFFLSWVSNAQLNHWTKGVVITQLITLNPRDRPGPLPTYQNRKDDNVHFPVFLCPVFVPTREKTIFLDFGSVQSRYFDV
jgi:hypothetical protein